MLGAINAMFASDDERTTKRDLGVHPPFRHPVRARIDAHRRVAAKQGDAGRRRYRMALLSADGLRAIDQSARPGALDASRLTIEQTKLLRAPAAPRAYEPRPKAAAGKAHRPDADLVFDAIVAEPDKRGLRVPFDLM